jgi:hypothetical protein
MLGKDPSPTALRSPLSPVERAKIIVGRARARAKMHSPSPRGRGGTARRWMRGLLGKASAALPGDIYCLEIGLAERMCLAKGMLT